MAKAESNAIEFKNRVNELRLSLGLAKAMLKGERSKRALLLGKRIGLFLDVLNELNATS